MGLPVLHQVLEIELSNDLFEKLVRQIEKDFTMTGINYNFENLDAHTLVVCLHDVVEHLLSREYSTLLSLLYRIDIPQSVAGENIEGYSVEESIVIQILKREWQKIVLKQKYSANGNT